MMLLGLNLNYLLFISISLISCNNQKPVPINQIFKQGNYVVHNIFFENGESQINVYKDQKLVCEQSMGSSPILIKAILNDTVRVEKLVIGGIDSAHKTDTPTYVDINMNLTIAVSNHFYSGTMNGGEKKIDSLHLGDDVVVFFSPFGRDSIPLNELLFDGETSFHTISFNRLGRLDVFYRVEDKNLLKQYWTQDRHFL